MLNALAASSLDRVSSTLRSFYQLRLNKIHKFKAKVDIYMEVGPFILKTVSSVDELKEALELRYQIFHREMIGRGNETGIDVDEFDFHCDHLIIIEKRSQAIVGTYRLNCSLYNDKFYSAQEFNISKILAQPGVKLELGRACIHKDYRRGLVISLLWRGIAQYMTVTDAQILFGCASIKTEEPRQAALLLEHFIEQGRYNELYDAPPTAAYVMPYMSSCFDLMDGLTPSMKEEAEELLPPLCRTYLKIGAFVGGAPAWDREFKCIDFLTILRREDLNKTLWKKFRLDSAES